MSNSKAGRKDLVERKERRLEVKELYLKDFSINKIATELGMHPDTARKYVAYWQAYYTKLALTNPYIAEKQIARIEKLTDEVSLIKQELWTIYGEVSKKAKENLTSKRKDKPTYYNTRMDLLKSIMSRIETEQRLMKLFSPAELIQNNYISAEVLKEILLVFRGIIQEMVPQDKQDYAIKRMQSIDVQALSGKEIIDVEVVGE
ncbi:hypothetical protein LCGC14_0305790 [marine sediment metagenome]|uniref:Terminase ATPase subunit N-terminal domain-containing protein n=1 Tax=marine sediment metagenome TaxID=412755 RepID=A0A0F9TNU0_9ZZZZ